MYFSQDRAHIRWRHRPIIAGLADTFLLSIKGCCHKSADEMQTKFLDMIYIILYRNGFSSATSTFPIRRSHFLPWKLLCFLASLKPSFNYPCVAIRENHSWSMTPILNRLQNYGTVWPANDMFFEFKQRNVHGICFLEVTMHFIYLQTTY